MASVYNKYVKTRGYKIYSSRLIELPRPEFIVLYSGEDEYPDEKILKLSDAYFDLPKGHMPSGDLELEVRVLNVNKKCNQAVTSKSIELSGYVTLVDEIRKNKATGMELVEAIDKAVEDCKARNILYEFLQKYGGGIVDMLYAEWNLEEYGAAQREDGKLAGLLEAAKAMLEEGDSPEKVARCTGLPLEQVRELQLQPL
jgi:predicted transposase/invertase (TIGR01784 family)